MLKENYYSGGGGGGNAFKKQQEFIIALSGSFDILVDNGFTVNRNSDELAYNMVYGVNEELIDN